MKPFQAFQTGQNPWSKGARLALLNAALAAFSIASFLGVLNVITSINQQRLSNGGALPELSFPYPVLMLFYVVMFLTAWVWVGRRFYGTRREKIIAALVGASPLFGLSLLGYAVVIGAVAFNAVAPEIIPAGSFYVFGGISTLILFAGITCAGLISLLSSSSGNSASPDTVAA